MAGSVTLIEQGWRYSDLASIDARLARLEQEKKQLIALKSELLNYHVLAGFTGGKDGEPAYEYKKFIIGYVNASLHNLFLVETNIINNDSLLDKETSYSR